MQPKKPGGFDEPPFMPPLDQCLRCGHWMDADRLELHQRTCNVDPVARVEQEKRLDRNREERIVREREEERLRELEREREWAQVEREREKMEKREREREQLERERIEERQRGAAEDKARAEELLAQERWVVSALRSKRDPDVIVVVFEQVAPESAEPMVRSWVKTGKGSGWRCGIRFPITEERTFERYNLEARFEVDGPGRVAYENQDRLDALAAALPRGPTS
jgi:hypothetical protein